MVGLGSDRVRERRAHWNRYLAPGTISNRVGSPAAADHRPADPQRERDNLLATHRGGRVFIVARGRCGAGLRLVVGDVELQEPGSLGVCHPFRASLPALRDASARVCRLPAIRPRMSGCDPMAVPEPLSGHDAVFFGHSERPPLEQQRIRGSGDGYFTVWVFSAISSATRRTSSDKT